MANDATLFVLYSPHENKSKGKAKKAKAESKSESKAKATWTYRRVPPKWWYVGGGGTSDPRFPHEEQFSGPHSTLPAMRAYLTRKFDALTTKKAVTRYMDPRRVPALPPALRKPTKAKPKRPTSPKGPKSPKGRRF